MNIFKSMILVTICALGVAACSNSTPPIVSAKDTVLVGQVANSDALIAIVKDETGFAAYICGGTNTWQTHTGWFRSSSVEKTNTLESSSGLKFSAVFADKTANGTVTLKDGTNLNWFAEQAVGAAGLFIREDADVLTGFIVDNKGNTAGTARALTDSGGFSSSPVVVNNPVATGTNTLTGTAMVNNSSRVMQLNRIAIPGLILVSASPTAPGPTVIVLVHGATNRFSAADAKALALDGVPGTRRHARLYWTEPFVDGLLGNEKRNPLVTLTGQNVAAKNFYTTGLPTQPNTVPDPSACDLDDFITTQDRLTTRSSPPVLSALLTHRNAGLGLVDQVVDASIQIKSCLDAFTVRYNRTPQLVFATHSMGGLVARFLLSRPAEASVSSSIASGILANPSNGTMTRYSNSAFANMEFIRNRTAYAITLATPHEGSRLADQRQPIRAKLVQLKNWLESSNNNLSDSGLTVEDLKLALRIATAAALNSGFATPDTSDLNLATIGTSNGKSIVRAIVKGFLKQFALPIINTAIIAFDNINATAIRDLTSATWTDLNRNLLHPNQMARGADSPIPSASNLLIPIHVAGARSAGGEVYDSLNLDTVLGTLNDYNKLKPDFEGESRAVGYIKQAMIGHAALEVIAGPKTTTDSRLDKRKYTDWFNEVMTLTENAIGGSLPRTIRLWRYAKTQVDTPVNTAIANYILSKIIGGTGSPRTPMYLKNKWRVDFGGQELVRVPALICRDGNGPILATIDFDLELFLQFLVKSGQTFEDGLDLINSSSLASFLSNLRDLGRDFLTLIGAIIDFVAEKRSEFAKLNDACTGPIDSLTNWKFGSVLQNVPAPRLIETSEQDSDGVIENDSLVEYDSAMGYKLGTSIVDFFDHLREDHRSIVGTNGATKPAPGSWYRFYSSALEPFNHDIMHKDVGVWISRTFIEPSTPAGAFVCATGTISSATPCN